MGAVGNGFGMIQVHYTYCALLFLFLLHQLQL